MKTKIDATSSRTLSPSPATRDESLRSRARFNSNEVELDLESLDAIVGGAACEACLRKTGGDYDACEPVCR